MQMQKTAIRTAALVALSVNLSLSFLKIVCGLAGASQVVVADGVHSLSDSITDIAIIAGVALWTKPPDDRHPYGHRRIETVVTLFIALFLAAAAVGLITKAVLSLNAPRPSPPGLIALAAVAISIIVKECLFRWSAAVGKKTDSTALIANAWHHRSDALSSIPALVAVAGAYISPRLWFLDPLGVFVVSLFIFKIAWHIGGGAFSDLLDTGAPEKDLKRIEQIAGSTSGVRSVHGVRTRTVGSWIHLDLHILVDKEITVDQGHDIAESVKQNILSGGPRVADVVVHVEPWTEKGNTDA